MAETLNLVDLGLTEVPLATAQAQGANVGTLNVAENNFV